MAELSGFFDSFLETAASLAVLFIIVAWVSSKVVELGQLATNMHGKMLRKELKRTFGDATGDFTRYFYWHPVVEPLTQPSRLVDLWRRFRRSIGRDEGGVSYPPGRLPGYLAPETFTAVVMNPFPWPTSPEPLRRLLAANFKDDQAPGPLTDDQIMALIRNDHRVDQDTSWNDYLAAVEPHGPPPDQFSPHFLRSNVMQPAGAAGGKTAIQNFRALCHANALVPHGFETRVVTLLHDAEQDIDEFRKGLARWYAEAMARVTGRFKRTSMICLFFIALGISAAFNLNTFRLLGLLMHNPQLRAEGVQAGSALGNGPEDIDVLLQKDRFARVYEAQVKTPDGCKEKCLRALFPLLWRNPRAPDIGELVKPKLKPEDGVAKLQDLCRTDMANCKPVFEATLRECSSAPGGEACPRALDEAFNNPDLFWDTKAAAGIAAVLAGKPAPAELPERLAVIAREARRQTASVIEYARHVRGAGPVWKDPAFDAATSPPATALERLTVLIGIVATALLAALGAPFWYDVLGRISGRGSAARKGQHG